MQFGIDKIIVQRGKVKTTTGIIWLIINIRSFGSLARGRSSGKRPVMSVHGSPPRRLNVTENVSFLVPDFSSASRRQKLFYSRQDLLQLNNNARPSRIVRRKLWFFGILSDTRPSEKSISSVFPPETPKKIPVRITNRTSSILNDCHPRQHNVKPIQGVERHDPSIRRGRSLNFIRPTERSLASQ